MLRHGHPDRSAPIPRRFGHETAGVRVDTGERGAASATPSPAARARRAAPGRAQICRDPTWVLGGFAERIARARGGAAPDPRRADVGRRRDGRAARGVRARGRARGTAATDVGVLGGGHDRPDARPPARARGPRRDGRRPPPRAPRAGRGARRAGGRERSAAPRARVRGGRPPRGVARGGRGGRARRHRRARRRLPRRHRGRAARAARCTTTSSTSAARSTTRRAEVDAALALLADGRRGLARVRVGADRARRPRPGRSRAPAAGEARKLVVGARAMSRVLPRPASRSPWSPRPRRRAAARRSRPRPPRVTRRP